MANQEPDILVQLDLALANAKRLRRDSTAVVQDVARIKETIENEQTEEVTSE
jgi:hypothetical protein